MVVLSRVGTYARVTIIETYCTRFAESDLIGGALAGDIQGIGRSPSSPGTTETLAQLCFERCVKTHDGSSVRIV